MNLYEKIVEIMKDVTYLQKDDTVGSGKATYKAISEEKVTSAVRESMIKNKVVILHIKQNTEEVFTEYEKEAYGKIEKKQRLLTRVDTTYKIINADNPEEHIEVVSSGSGVDSQDKGIGKAMTYAYKYMLLRSFAIPTGNDPDKIHNDELEKQGSVTKKITEKDGYNLQYTLQGGKHKGQNLGNLLKTDRDYLKWMSTSDKTPKELQEFLKEALEQTL